MLQQLKEQQINMHYVIIIDKFTFSKNWNNSKLICIM